MSLLADYAITPDVFDETCYPTEGECEARIETIREAMLTEGLVRDLRGGAWGRLFASDARPWHRGGIELVRILATQGRLVRFRPALPRPPRDDRTWCAEALATHAETALRGGVIVTESVKTPHADEQLVARIDRLGSTRWWAERGPSVTLARSFAAYREHLDLLLRHSNLLVFIDPHLDPAKQRYRQFGRLLERAGSRTPAPRVEIHRACYDGRDPERGQPRRRDVTYFRRRFGDRLAAPLRASGLSAEVFIWDKFHDRFLISNLAGISLPNGFDVSDDPHAVTRWTRLGRHDRDGVRREFHRNSRRHQLRGKFRLP